MTAQNEAAAGLVAEWSCEEKRGRCRNPYGCHCREIEALQRGKFTLLAQVEELRRERDEARRNHEGCAIRLAEAMNHRDELRSELTAAEALVAEGVKVCEPFATRAGKLDGHWLNHETNWSPAYGSTEITIGDLRAAAAFIQRAKESRT